MNNIIEFLGTPGFIVVIVGLVLLAVFSIYEFFFEKNDDDIDEDEKTFDVRL